MLVVALASLILLAATWIGYPLAIAAAAAARRRGGRGAPVGEQLPSVTVVLATRADDFALTTRVENLLSSEYPSALLDVVVAIDSGRETRPPAEPPRERVTVVPGDTPPGKATALNAAVRAARGEILVFADAAQRFAPQTVAHLVDELRHRPELTAVSGALHIATEEAESPVTRYWRFERWLRGVEARVHSPAGVTGAVYALRRSAWVPLPAGLILDDLYVPMQQVLRGHRVGFRDDAVAFDPRQLVGVGEYRRKSRTLTGVYQLCHLMPEVLSPSRNPIWLQFVFHKLLRLGTPLYLMAGTIGLLGWAITTVPPRVSAAALGGVTMLGLLVLAASPRARRIVGEVLAVQAAVVRAARNAWRGEWDVW